MTSKIISIENLSSKVKTAKKQGKKIVHCHGVFDLLHIGHIKHFNEAKSHGDILVVTVTPDEYVNKGPNRPAFTTELRLEALAALESIDFVAKNEWPTAVKTINKIKPDIYFKGPDYKDNKDDVTGMIKEESRAIVSVGGQIIYSTDITFSSSSILNKYSDLYSKEQKSFIASIRKEIGPGGVKAILEGFKDLKNKINKFPPEKMEKVTGVKVETIKKVARTYAKAKSAIIFWGMGISQHVHGTDNARALIALSLMCGQIGRPGTGLHPLRGQNNVQGASDAGLIPMVFPDYFPVEEDKNRKKLEKLWKSDLDPEPGQTVVEIMHGMVDGSIKGMYIMGENPAMSDPDTKEARKGLANLKHLVVQDLFLTETATFADVILPSSAAPEKDGSFTNTNRQVQMGRKAIPLPGNTKQDLWIINEIGKRLGLKWNYKHPKDVFPAVSYTHLTLPTKA